MSNNKALMDMMESILNEVKILGKAVKSMESRMDLLETNVNLIKETSNLTHAKVSNLSSKVDLNISTLNIISSDSMIKSPAATSTGVVPKRRPNIMAWSKSKFTSDPELIYSVVGKKNVEDLFEKFKKEINDKKSGKKDALIKYKELIVYKELIQKNTDYVAKLKNIKAQEEDGQLTPSTEITENNSPLRKEIKEDILSNSDVEDESIADTADVNDDSSNNSDSD